jgi:hypothetical protein
MATSPAVGGSQCSLEGGRRARSGKGAAPEKGERGGGERGNE